MDDGFAPGAVRQVELRNFQICSEITYRFGPKMNLISAPNGSGKSTVIIALYVVFQGKIADISKESYLDFIRMGEDEAHIKIVLQGKTAGELETVEMTISRSQDNFLRPKAIKAYKLNGSRASQDDIEKLVDSYNIQVNNLCQFLPQERVAAFSGQTPAERLRSTEAAVGSSQMVKIHDQLASKNDDLLQVREQAEHLKKSVEELEQRVAELTQQLQSAEQLHQSEQEHTRLLLLEKVVLYFDIMKQQRTLDQEIERITQALRSVESAGPLVERLQESQQQSAASKRTYDEAMLAHDSATAAVTTAADRASRLRESVAETFALLVESYKQKDSYTDRLKQAKEMAQEARREVRSKQNRLQPPELVQQWQDELEDTLANLRGAEEQVDDFDAQMRNIRDQLRRLASQRHAIERSVAASQNATATHYKDLQSVLRSDRMVRAIELVRANAHRFEQPVLEPAILTVSITKPEAAPLLLTAAKDSQMQRFICQTERDFKTFDDLLGEHGLSVPATYTKGTASLDSLRRFSQAELQRLGFDGLLIDVCAGPEPVLRYLSSVGLGRTPYTLGTVSEDVSQMLARQNFTGEYVDRAGITNVMRSRYGRRQLLSTTRQLKQGTAIVERFMRGNNGNDDEEVARANARLQALDAQVQNVENSQERLTAEQTGARQLYADLDKKRLEIAEKTNAATQAKRSFDAARQRADTAETDLERVRAQKDQFLNRQKEQYEQLRRLTAELGTALGVDPTAALQSNANELFAFLDYETARSDESQYGAQIAFEKRAYETQLDQLRSQKQRDERARAEHQEGYMQVKRAVNRQEMRALETEAKATEDVATVRQRIAQLKAQMVLNDRGLNYTEIRSRLDTAEKSLEETRTAYNAVELQLNTSMEAVRTQQETWERDVERMISSIDTRFSDLMGRTGCRGNVRLLKDRQFQNWGIDILVSFREDQELQRLARSVQSGGERALCTAMYLLAMQGMSTAPFRVLDEINQGMDDRNERATHEYIVKTACSPESKSQYILITPKLLMDLYYGTGDGLHCSAVLNGPNVDRTRYTIEDEFDGLRADHDLIR